MFVDQSACALGFKPEIVLLCGTRGFSTFNVSSSANCLTLTTDSNSCTLNNIIVRQARPPGGQVRVLTSFLIFCILIDRILPVVYLYAR